MFENATFTDDAPPWNIDERLLAKSEEIRARIAEIARQAATMAPTPFDVDPAGWNQELLQKAEAALEREKAKLGAEQETPSSPAP